MVIRLGCYLVEKGWFKSVNLIYLVKGHTKNHCDRFFNLLKNNWRKRNCFCFNDAMDLMSNEEKYELKRAKNLFFDYDLLFDSFYKRPESGTVSSNHIFTFSKRDNKIYLRTKVGDNFNEF